jgi:hypothetical protein
MIRGAYLHNEPDYAKRRLFLAAREIAARARVGCRYSVGARAGAGDAAFVMVWR